MDDEINEPVIPLAPVGLSKTEQELAEVKQLMADFQKNYDEFQTMRQTYGADMQTLNEQMKILQNADKEIQTKQFDIKREMRRVEKDVLQKERVLNQEVEQKRLAEQFRTMADEYDRITADAPWRSAALTHQTAGAKILANAKRGLLGDKRGLGKTLTSLITADMLGARKIIYISPGDVIRTVEREIQHWAPHRQVAPLGMMPKAQRKFAINMLRKQTDFVITVNYEAWRKDKSLLADIVSLQCDTIILDEAHNMKEKKKIAFRGVEAMVYAANKCPECGGLASPAKSKVYSWLEVATCIDCGNQASQGEPHDWCSLVNVFPMTGTPILNKPQDLFPLLNLIDRKNFTDEYTFLRDYCTQDMYTSKWGFRAGGLDSLIIKLSGRFLVRDRKSAGVVLPEQHETIYDLELTPEEYPEQWKFAKQLNEHAALLLEEDKTMDILAIIALITRKRQMMTWPDGITFKDPETKEIIAKVDCQESIKLDKCIKVETIPNSSDYGLTGIPVVGDIDGLIPELTADGDMESGERLVLFSQFKQPLIELERRCKLAGISVVRYDGDTPKSVQDEVVIDFDRKYCNAPGYTKKWQVVLAHYKKGGVGLNLTDATQMIILDEEWNPGKKDQAYGRIDRMGQTEETTVHVLRVERSVDTWMSAINDEKAEMIDGFESAHSVAQSMLDAIRNGEMI